MGVMQDAPRVSIVLRSFNEGWALRETLPALRAQHHREWELLVFDSGSTDGSVELIRQAQPRHFIQLQPHDYRPGWVLNQGMKLARHDRVIFLNADATPQGPDWLGPLVRALEAPQVAAVFGRQIPRPDCAAVFARDPLAFRPRPLRQPRCIDLDLQFEMGEAVTHQAGLLLPRRGKRRLLQRRRP